MEIPRGSHQKKSAEVASFRLDRARSQRATQVISRRVDGTTKRLTRVWRIREEEVAVWRCDGELLESLQCEARRRDPRPRIPEDFVIRILDLCGNEQLRVKHSHALRTSFIEVQREFGDVLRQSEECRVFSVCNEQSNLFSPWLEAGRSSQFERRRRRLARILHVTHPLARRALSAAHVELPRLLVSLEDIWLQGLQEPLQFAKKFQNQVRDSSERLRDKWYSNLARAAKGALGVPPSEHSRLLRCLCCLVAVQVRELQRRSLLHILEIFSRDAHIPKFELRAELLPSGRIALEPSEQELAAALHSLLHAVSSSAQHLPRLGTDQEDEALIPVRLDDTFLSEAHAKLTRALDLQLSGVHEHLKELETSFNPLYGEKTAQEQAEFLSGGSHNFEVLSERVHQLRRHLMRVLAEPPSADFPIASLDKRELLVELQRRAKALVQNVVSVMESQHQKECRSICAQFRAVAARAEATPGCTEELMSTGDFMENAEQNLMSELEQRIGVAAHQMAFLMRLRYLSPQHTSLINEAVCWLARIKPTFTKFTENYDEQRAYFERALQKRTDQLNRDLEDTMPRLAVVNTMNRPEHLREYLEEARQLQRRIAEFEDEAGWINKEEQLFRFPLSTYPELDELKNLVVPVWKLLRLCHSWQMTHTKWMDGAFDELDASQIEAKTSDIYRETEEMQTQFRAMIKQQITDNNPRRLRGVLDDPDPSNLPAPLQLCHHMLLHLRSFKGQIPLARVLCNPSLTVRHWSEMSTLLDRGIDIKPDAGSSLRKMIALSLDTEMLQKFEVISFGASKELELQEGLLAMVAALNAVTFDLELDPEQGCTVLTRVAELQALLADQLLRTQAMRGSAFAKPHAAELREWHGQFRRAADTIETWGSVQAQWRRFAPVFSGADIQQLMPAEARLFTEVDITYRKAMRAVEDDPIVMAHAARHGVLEDFARCSEHLEAVNQGVTSYLELKRQAFPRFFFLSNEEILSVVSESRDPRRLERFLRKCFPGAHGAIWKESGNLVALEGSVPGQRLPLLDHEVTWHVAGRVETWLQQVELSMVEAMKLQLVGCLNDSRAIEDRSNWARRWPVQVVLATIRSKWTSTVEASLKSPTRSPLSKLLETLHARVAMGCVALRAEVAAEERCALEALVTADCHAAEVTQSLTKASGLQDFAWVSQLRFYSSGGGTVFQGRLMYTNLYYGWEFLGDTSAGIVVTPHTLRCLRALVTAHRMGVGTCLQGPAGSGKSAAVAALAIALGKFLVSVTCSPAMDHRAIAKAIQGAAGTGAWLVLEDVQRLTPGTLSVASQHLLELSRACDSSLEALCLRGYGPVPLSQQRCLVCLSAQPDSRTLPTNLRSLFRPVYVDEADMMFVCRIRLLCYGFQEAATLASQLTELLRLCQQLLNPLPHYSFGMCAALRVVAEAGQLLHEVVDEECDEVAVICGGARRVLLPLLVQADHSRFLALLRDVFGAVSQNSREAIQSDFNAAILKECEGRLFQPTELFIRKVTETRDVLQVSRGIALVGETFSGKTAAIQVLQGAMQRLGVNVKCARVSPKALSLVQLFGEFDPHTAEWRDGVVTKTLREMGNCEEIGWLVLDGPVEASWAETLHAALDDSQRLSLPSGEIINIKNGTSIILEAGDLSQASPGTVSRCGCIHFSASGLGWRAPLRSWLREHEKAGTLWAQRTEGNLVFDLLDWMVPPCERFLERHGKRLVKPGTNNLVRTTTNIFAMLLREACSDPEAPKHIKIWIQAAMMSAGAWAFGGTLELRSKEAFDEMFKTLWKGLNSENPLPPCLEGKVDVAVPSEGLLIDHSFMFKFKGAWKHWPDALRSLKMDEKPSLHDLTVPTMDTARYLWMLGMHVEANTPTLLVGGSDTGKSTLARHLLLERLPAKRQPLLLRLTHLTSATALQEEFAGQLSKRADGGLGPASGRDSCVVFIDDLGVPRREKGGAQPPLELLRQMVDHRAWFHDCELVPIEALLVMGALSPNPHTPVCPRLLRHFSLLGLSAPADETLVRIFATVLNFALKNNGFASDVAAVASAMVQSTLETVRSLSAQLRRMPGRGPHLCALGLRDVQRVILGCAQVRKEHADNKRVLVRLWTHEALRSLSDRLHFPEERALVLPLLERAVRENFKEQPSAVFEQLPRGEDGQVTSETLEALVFLRGFKGGGYAEVNSERELHNRMQAALDDFNAGSGPSLDIVLFPSAVHQACRVARVLGLPRGSTLLLGRLGRGRRALVHLASHFCGHRIVTPSSAASYTEHEWRSDLRKALRSAGADGKDTVFVVGEAQLRTSETILRDIHCVLSEGHVPGLFSLEERQDIMEAVMLDAQGGKRNVDLSPMFVFNFFASRCQDRLHWAICLDPESPNFHSWLRRYPALLSHSTPIYFAEWPASALGQISARHAAALNVKPELRAPALRACQHFHCTAKELSERFAKERGRIVEIGARSYVELMQLSCALLETRQVRTQRDRHRYIVGLEKLQLAATQVQRIQEELGALQPRLADAAMETNGMLEVIETETQKVCEASLLVRRDEAVANVQAAAAQDLKSECETELAQAIPILEDAVAALNTLKPTDITLVKSMKNPPEPIKLVMAAVCVIRNIKPDRLNDAATGRKVLDYWGPSKKLLGEITFLQQLRDFDKDNIATATIAKIRRDFIPHPDFRPDVVANASSAAEGLCKWVRAMDMYDAVAKEVAPKKVKLEAAQQEYAATLAVLEEKRAQVRRLERQLAELQAQFHAANLHKQQLEAEFSACAHKLKRAEKLIGGLGGERERWAATSTRLQEDLDTLLGDVLLASAVVTYLGPFTTSYRNEYIEEWTAYVRELGVPCSPQFDFCRVMGSPLRIEQWNLAGLPRDMVSTQNALIAQHSLRVCLAIDPQRQAVTWMRNLESARGLRELRFPSMDFASVVSECAATGVPVLVAELGENDVASLVAALREMKLPVAKGTEAMAGDEEQEDQGNGGFRLFLATPQSQPQLAPEVYCHAAVIDFTLPTEGLEDQLLGIIMAAERPALRLSRQQAVVEGARNRAALQRVEERILTTLSQSQGNILEDEAAVDILDTAKSLAEELAEKQARAEQTLREIAEFRDEHSELARDAAAVFDTLSALPALNSSYQFPLNWFLQHFSASIRESSRMEGDREATSNEGGRQGLLFSGFVRSLCAQVELATLQRDRAPFHLLLCLNLLRARGEATQAELDFLLSCAPSNVDAEEQTKSDEQPPEGMSGETWRRVCGLEQLPGFEGLSARVRMNVNKYLQREEIENSDLTALKGLLLTATFAPQKLAERACSLADKQLRLEELNGSTVLPAALEHSSCTTPLVCVLGEGADVTAQLFPLAERAECTSLAVISMAPDQGKHAAAEIAAAQKRGTWVCLLNCHLAGTWLRELERLCEPSDPQKINSSFRLWITCDADQQLPPRVVQCSVKVAVEAAAGLRGAACHALLLQAARMEECAGRESTFCRLAFGLSVLHARLLGRKQLGPPADAPFDLQDADLDLASRHLWFLCSEHRRVPLEAAGDLVGESCYLARARGAWEKRTLRLLLNDCISATLLSLTRKPDNARQLRAPYIPTLETCLKNLQGFPERAEPEEYGLHARSGVARELIASNLLLDDAARLLNPSIANGQAIDSAKHRTGLRDTALWLLQQMPDLGDGMSSSPSRPTPVTVQTRSSVEEPMQVHSSRGGSDVALTRQGSSRRTLHAKSSEGGTDSAATTLGSELGIVAQADLPSDAEGSPADVTIDEDPLSAARTFESTQLTRSVLAVKADLEGILMALDGGSELVGPLAAVSRDLAFHRVPQAWSSLHSGLATPTLPAFVSHIQSRALALQEWVGGGALWLGGFTRPDMVLAALRQFHARATATSITRITLDFRLLDSDSNTGSSEGFLIKGIFLDGAHWNNEVRHLVEQQASESASPLPLLWVRPSLKQDSIELPTYECPLYRGPGRRNVLTSVNLPSDPNILPEHWTRRGVALFLLAP